jgi:hypothetical protein
MRTCTVFEHMRFSTQPDSVRKHRACQDIVFSRSDGNHCRMRGVVACHNTKHTHGTVFVGILPICQPQNRSFPKQMHSMYAFSGGTDSPDQQMVSNPAAVCQINKCGFPEGLGQTPGFSGGWGEGHLPEFPL